MPLCMKRMDHPKQQMIFHLSSYHNGSPLYEWSFVYEWVLDLDVQWFLSLYTFNDHHKQSRSSMREIRIVKEPSSYDAYILIKKQLIKDHYHLVQGIRCDLSQIVFSIIKNINKLQMICNIISAK